MNKASSYSSELLQEHEVPGMALALLPQVRASLEQL